MADVRIGEPRRHSALAHGIGDSMRHRLNLLVRHERHRADFTGSMTTLAVLLQNRQYIAIKRGRTGGAWRPVRGRGLRMARRGCAGEKRERGKKRGDPNGSIGHSAREIFRPLNANCGHLPF